MRPADGKSCLPGSAGDFEQTGSNPKGCLPAAISFVCPLTETPKRTHTHPHPRRNVLLGLIRAARWDCTAGLAPMLYSEVLARLTGAARGSAMPLMPFGPLPPMVHPFSKATMLRRLLSDQVRWMWG